MSMYVKISINSIINKFDALVNVVRGNVDIFMISKIKIDDSCPTRKFLIERFTTRYRLHWNGSSVCVGGGGGGGEGGGGGLIKS